MARRPLFPRNFRSAVYVAVIQRALITRAAEMRLRFSESQVLHKTQLAQGARPANYHNANNALAPGLYACVVMTSENVAHRAECLVKLSASVHVAFEGVMIRETVLLGQ